MKAGARFTGRGLALLILGGVAAVAAALIGELDLLWLALALVGLPIISLLYLLLAKPRITHERILEPATLPIGETTRVVLRVINEAPAQSSALRFNDSAGHQVGGGATFVIARGFGRWHQAVGYSVEAGARGRFRIGPLTALATDPFGFARRSVRSAGADSLLRVTPRVWPLLDLPLGSGLGAAGDATPQRIGQAGTDDVLVREHRYGDDMRRVHWKMSAKRDELMVRLEEHPWDPSSTLIVDTRLSAHPDHGPQGSLEWAVSAITSLAALLLEGRHRMSIVAPSGAAYTSGHSVGPVATTTMLEAMTDLPASEHTRLGEAFSDPGDLASVASLVAVTGKLTADDAAALSAVGSRARSAFALVPHEDWGQLSAEHADACRLLRNNGWQIGTYAPGETVPEAWARLPR